MIAAPANTALLCVTRIAARRLQIDTRLDTNRAKSPRENRTGQQMRFNSSVFRIDPIPRKVGDGYVAHAKITCSRGDGGEQDIHLSGSLAGFDIREDAVSFATSWAMEWLERRYG